MKLERWVRALLSSALAFCISLGSVGCLVSAFELSLASYPGLVLTCLIAAILCSLVLSGKRGGLALLLLAGLLMGYLWRRGEAVQQLGQLLYRISYVYDRAYHWGYLKLADSAWNAGVADLPMAVLGCAIAASAAWEICRGKSGMVAILLAVLPLCACLVVTDTTPDEVYLFLLLLGLIELVLTARVRMHSCVQGCRLLFMTLVPTAAALGLLFWMIPQAGYVSHAEQIRNTLLQYVRKVPDVAASLPETPLQTIQSQEPESVNLASLGSRFPSSAAVMKVTADTGGTLYLRGRDYDIYDGTGWETTLHRTEKFTAPEQSLGLVTVETVSPFQQIYLPYYPEENLSLVGGRLENTGLYQSYTCTRMGFAQDLPVLLSAAENIQGSYNEDLYLVLPEQTRERARAILSQLSLSGQTVTDRAQEIADYVRSSARYDLQTQRMPEGEEDFALWFLEQADRGYCVHFATAAVVLLRTAGIEARYVSGYMVRAGAGETVTVTGEHAHAWAEYYEPALGLWLALEATPSAGEETPEQTVPEMTTMPVEPPSSEPGTQTTPQQPEQTEQSNPTKPEPPGSRKWLALFWVLPALAGVAATIQGQRVLRLTRRRRGQKNGPANAQALARWREAVLLAKLLKQPVPEGLEALAQKAKFSQHTLTEEELLAFEAYLRGARRKLARQRWYRRLVYQYGYALF